MLGPTNLHSTRHSVTLPPEFLFFFPLHTQPFDIRLLKSTADASSSLYAAPEEL